MKKMSNADLFINITNDAWFGDTASPHQHAMLTTVQAIEWGRPLLRIAYTGVSFVVEPTGKILYETAPFVEEAKVEELRLTKVNTIYRQGGWVFPWLWVLSTPLLLLYMRKKNRIELISDSTAVQPSFIIDYKTKKQKRLSERCLD